MGYIYRDIARFDSSELRGLYDNDNLLISYLSEEVVKEKHNLYMYIEMLDNGQIAVKFGKTKDSIYIRYKGEQNLIKNYNRCIWVGDSSFGDEYGHTELQKRASIHKMYKYVKDNHSDENYEMPFGFLSVKKFIEDVEDIYNTHKVRKFIPLYDGIAKLAKEIFLDGKKRNLLYLCTRWGKTRTNLSLMQLYNYTGIRVSIIASYVGTVRNSYLHDIETLKQYEDFKFYDCNDINSETISFIKKWLNDNDKHHVVIYLPLTGDIKCYNRRKENIKDLSEYKKLIFVEEADFGAHCDSQLQKLDDIIKSHRTEYLFVTTGTGYEKAIKFFEKYKFKEYIKDYIDDVLCCS